MGRVGNVRYSLESMAARGLLPTLRASDAEKAGPHQTDSLEATLRMLPTITAGDAKSSGNRGPKAHPGLSLADLIERGEAIPTLTARDYRTGSMKRRAEPKRHGAFNLNDVAGGKLNPEWCEWFMGWPIGATGLGPLGMDRFPSWQRAHSGSLLDASSTEARE